ncbi:Sigma-70, region 4 [Lentzea xinjiangensis]|uniref:Sigma-70, region 4 n=1 Tax=Lentzea xinjiangensis TaxID=402600 RepID=A0A1H9RJZ3_9PSEU|nr:sigma factor-like helix-turn-helix DNA-binding protein [Lentzea xinjiangensis]SER72898.1 Sigma-70, region 4 [Lentzea xinjiangensis]
MRSFANLRHHRHASAAGLVKGSATPGPRHLAVLTEEQRAVLELRVVRGLSAEQVAQALDLTPAAVRLVQHQALEALRAVLRRPRPLPP